MLPCSQWCGARRARRCRRQHGVQFERSDIIGAGLHKSSARDDVAILHFVGTDRGKLEALPKLPYFVDLLKKAGNREVAKPLVGEDVVRSR